MRRALLLAALLSAGGAWAAEPAAVGIAFEKCKLSAPTGARQVEAECGSLSVPEDRATAGGKKITLHVAVVRARAKAREKAPDPVFLLAGGPGQAATATYVSMEGAFEWILRRRDVVLVDQRGTGKSNALTCDFGSEEAPSETANEEARAEITACLAKLPGDPRFYTTSVALDDLEAVRRAMGLGPVNLYGGSYGTRVGLAYLRKYPDSTRSVVLDGVVPMDLALGPDISIDSQHALDLMFTRCAEDAGCAQAFPDLRREFTSLVDRLRGRPVPVTLRDPVSGEQQTTSLTYGGAASAVRMLLYASESLSLLPLLIHTAAGGDYAPLAALATQVRTQANDSMSLGMHMAVVCTEDVPFLTRDSAHETEMGDTYLGVYLMNSLEAVCAVWPKGVIDPDFKSAVKSAKPVLLLSGEIDPVTPPRNAEHAQKTLSHSRHLVAPHHGHIVVTRGCGPRLFASFVDSADPRSVDGRCLEGLHGAPFFVRFSGPEP